jgi:hypothetical protein
MSAARNACAASLLLLDGVREDDALENGGLVWFSAIGGCVADDSCRYDAEHAESMRDAEGGGRGDVVPIPNDDAVGGVEGVERGRSEVVVKGGAEDVEDEGDVRGGAEDVEDEGDVRGGAEDVEDEGDVREGAEDVEDEGDVRGGAEDVCMGVDATWRLSPASCRCCSRASFSLSRRRRNIPSSSGASACNNTCTRSRHTSPS